MRAIKTQEQPRVTFSSLCNLKYTLCESPVWRVSQQVRFNFHDLMCCDGMGCVQHCGKAARNFQFQIDPSVEFGAMKKSDPQSVKSCWQLGNPMLGMMVDSDAPGVIFHPMKAMAIGQMQLVQLCNRRFQACAEFPQKLAACKSPNDFMQLQMRFWQTALSDYSNAVQSVADAWEKAVDDQSEDKPKTPNRPHDVLSLPGMTQSARKKRPNGPQSAA